MKIPMTPTSISNKASAKRAALYTLGCRLNQAETRLIEDQLRAAGYTVVPFDTPAEVGVIHTCVVTREAEAKSRKMIRRFLRANPGAAAVVIGCYAQTEGAALAEMEGVRLVLGNGAKMDLAEHLAALTGEVVPVRRERAERGAFTVPFVESGPPILRRVNLKIQDGCDCMCRYCYIPFARGRSRSRRFDDVMREAAALVRRGAKELVLTGVNSGDYLDNEKNLTTLVDHLNTLRPRPRVRISSIELMNIPDDLVERMADAGHALVPHLHIPLQSGSDAVLRAMGRTYTAAQYLDFVNRAATLAPDMGVGADVMVGFPGETDADFEATCELIRQSPLFYLHVFQYSERPEVASARLPDKVSPAIMHKRSEILRKLASERTRCFQQHWIGNTVEVLFESRQDALWHGHTANYLEVAVPADECLQNRFARVRLDAIRGQCLFGDLSKP